MNDPTFDPKLFLSELCRYYMEFLETDFKDKRLPARKIMLRNSDSMLTGIDLSRYPGLNNKALALLADGFHKNPFKKVKRTGFGCAFRDTFLEPDSYRIAQDARTFKDGEIDNDTSPPQHKLPDFHDEFYELWKNKLVMEKQDFYLYLLNITYDSTAYPLFYISVSVELAEDSFSCEFDPVLLINTKAIQYVSQKYAEETKKEWKIDLPPRHIYLSGFEQEGDLLKYLQGLINEVSAFFGMDQINLSQINPDRVTNGRVSVSTQCYISLFDRSDEALMNDYEELLTLTQARTDTRAFDIFSKLGSDYLFENPVSFERLIDEGFDGLPVSDKLVYSSPIPLNREQRQILVAIAMKDCNRIIVEGPPGTGKSHTIAAIINNALLNKQSVLMVSDQKDALDVVEEMINRILEKMKLDDFIQNPIVRLGRKENTFVAILKEVNYGKIKSRYNAVKRHKQQVGYNIEEIQNRMKRAIDEEIEIGSSLDGASLEHLIAYAQTFRENHEGLLDLTELGSIEGSCQLLYDFCVNITRAAQEIKLIQDAYNISFDALPIESIDTEVRGIYRDISALQQKIDNEYRDFLLAGEMTAGKLEFLESCLKKLDDLDKPIIGYLFSGKQLRRLENEFREQFFLPGVQLRKMSEKLSIELQFYKKCRQLNESWENLELDTFRLINREDGCRDLACRLEYLSKTIRTIREIALKLPSTYSRMVINGNILSCRYAHIPEEELIKMTGYLKTYFSILKMNRRLAVETFKEDRKELEDAIALRMTAILDESVVYFRENSKNDAEELRKLIRAKKQIPKEYLKKLVGAFPCVIVGVRELAEYIPLEPNIFDIAIIDEASQVSIAQAFPVILRAKKIVVLGDPKQYSNVKSHNASVSVNNYLFNRVKIAFEKSIAVLDAPKREMVNHKVGSFNIKNSILDFLRNITNYQCTLKKHFRSYNEIIGYSNRTFYQNAMQVMKIRGKHVDEIIQFHRVKTPDGERYKNTNETEAVFILDELNRLKYENFEGTVGVITPFTNQQKLISNLVYSTEDWHFFHEKFRFRVMTFDSCQGDERDIIYYSMVEKEHENILRFIFPVKFERIGDEEDGNLKAQRLNVGFSRAKESIRFVLSKDPESIGGEIGKALQFYNGQLKKPDHADVLKNTDPASPMEAVIYGYITRTPFYEMNEGRIEIMPQFDIGSYIKQLNPYARIPDYRCDFLMLYHEASGRTKMIIIEYDGIEYHFKDNDRVDAGNFERFYIEEDVERRRTIESYGYDFIRLNKFVLGNDPVGNINERFETLFKNKIAGNGLHNDIAESYEKMQDGQLRRCSKCGLYKHIEDFRNISLKTGTGKICNSCRNESRKKVHASRTFGSSPKEATPLKCPRCKSPMVLRKSKHGQFYGCSKFPNCKGTRRFV